MSDMKTKTGIVVMLLLFMSPLFAQTETLTNSGIIKMSQARLTDELIISVIEDSEVSFDLDNQALSELKKADVSDAVIEAMKSAAGINGATATAQVSVESSGSLLSPSSVEALGYVGPLTGLITFFEEDFKSMNSTIEEWNTMITGSLAEIRSLNEEIAKAEAELAVLKNADANGYSSEVIEKRKALIDLREKFEGLRAAMLDDGEEIAEKLAATSSQKVKSISKQYSTVSQRVKSAGGDPANPGDPVRIDLATLTIPEGINTYISPANELFHWYRNEIEDIIKTIAEWNIKVENAVAEYGTLKAKLDPVESQLEEFEKNSKQHKEEISSLKDQQSAIEKEIKALEKKMENDGSKLSAFIKEAGGTIQKTIEERIADIISGINFLYHQKLNV